MRTWTRLSTGLALALALAATTGCAGGAGDAKTAEAAREKAKAGWVLELEGAGEGGALALERMDIYLSDEASDPERFVIEGDGVVLVGLVPAALRVGYGEEFDRLVGRTLAIDPSGGDPSEPQASTVTVGGIACPVAGGGFTVEKVTGRWAGSEGDRTLHGTIELRVLEPGGERAVRGRLAVHAVTWG